MTQSVLTSHGDVKSLDNFWGGLTDPAERRRRQNRVNQRAHRRPQRMLADKDIHPTSVAVFPSSTDLVHSKERVTLGQGQKLNRCISLSVVQLLLHRFAQAAYQSYMLGGSPTSDHLLALTKANVFHAFNHNLQLMGFSSADMEDDAILPFNVATPPEASSPEKCEMPLSLRPTKIQRTVPHHPWIDLFPLPKWRDNLILAGNDWDDEQLCHDIMGFWDTTAEEGGLLVWGEPWDVRNWDLTEAFLKKWPWTVQGCPELMSSTNAWRAKHGEKLIFRYIYREPISGNEEEGCEAEDESEDDSEDEISSVQATTQWKDRTKSSLQKRTVDVLADVDNGLSLPEMLIKETTKTQAARSGRIQKKPRWELDLRLTVHNVKYSDRKYTRE